MPTCNDGTNCDITTGKDISDEAKITGITFAVFTLSGINED